MVGTVDEVVLQRDGVTVATQATLGNEVLVFSPPSSGSYTVYGNYAAGGSTKVESFEVYNIDSTVDRTTASIGEDITVTWNESDCEVVGLLIQTDTTLSIGRGDLIELNSSQLFAKQATFSTENYRVRDYHIRVLAKTPTGNTVFTEPIDKHFLEMES